MKKLSLHAVMALFFTALLSACSGLSQKPAQPIVPGEIEKVLPLTDAIHQVQDAIARADKRNDDEKMGTVVSKVTIALQVTAGTSSTDGKSATIGLAITPITIGGSLSNSQTANHSAQSTITLEFTNPVLASKDSVLGSLSTGLDKDKDLKNKLNKMVEDALKPTQMQEIKQ